MKRKKMITNKKASKQVSEETRQQTSGTLYWFISIQHLRELVLICLLANLVDECAYCRSPHKSKSSSKSNLTRFIVLFCFVFSRAHFLLCLMSKINALAAVASSLI